MNGELERNTNETWNLFVFMQLIASFDRSVDFSKIKHISIEAYDFLTKTETSELEQNLPRVQSLINSLSTEYLKRYKPKLGIAEVAEKWNELFREKKEPFLFGIEYGWLEELLDLSSFRLYTDYIPYHFRIGLAHNKGHFSIEEDFLLNDAFNQLIKSQKTNEILLKYAEEIKKAQKSETDPLSNEHYTDLSNIKFEIASYARTSVISFYAFVECFVNSVGYSYLMYSRGTLTEEESQLLKGKRKNRYISLKDKIKEFPQIICSNQSMTRAFGENERKFFEIYEDLRNSAVHFSPLKTSISLKPDVWLEKAKEFSLIAIAVARSFWNDCYPNTDGPQYLGKLEYERFYAAAEIKIQRIKEIESKINR